MGVVVAVAKVKEEVKDATTMGLTPRVEVLHLLARAITPKIVAPTTWFLLISTISILAQIPQFAHMVKTNNTVRNIQKIFMLQKTMYFLKEPLSNNLPAHPKDLVTQGHHSFAKFVTAEVNPLSSVGIDRIMDIRRVMMYHRQ